MGIIGVPHLHGRRSQHEPIQRPTYLEVERSKEDREGCRNGGSR